MELISYRSGLIRQNRHRIEFTEDLIPPETALVAASDEKQS